MCVECSVGASVSGCKERGSRNKHWSWEVLAKYKKKTTQTTSADVCREKFRCQRLGSNSLPIQHNIRKPIHCSFHSTSVFYVLLCQRFNVFKSVNRSDVVG